MQQETPIDRDAPERERGPAAAGPPAGRRDERLVVLDALLANPAFRASERNKRFLKFVVEETVAGRADRIKAFTIAVDVFGRSADFDASVDPIVRIAAGQLRKSLQSYYAGPGRGDTVQIGLPLGAYVPVFEKKRSPLRRGWAAARARAQRPGWGLSAALALVAGVAVATAAFLASVPAMRDWMAPERPVVILDSTRHNTGDPAVRAFARRLTETLWVKMGRYSGVRFVGVRAGEELAQVAERARETFGAGSDLYQLLTSVQFEEGDLRVYWHLVDANSRETYYSARTGETIARAERDAAAEAVAGTVAESLFGSGGVIAEGVDGTRILATDTSGP